jgi:hypothetical protein
MITATLFALAAAAAPVSAAAQPRAVLKQVAAGAPACRTVPAGGSLVEAPLFARESARCPVARVGDDVIVLGELAATLEGGHMARSPRTKRGEKSPGMDFTPALDRLITTRLVAEEARDMGLDEDPTFKEAVEDFRASRLRAALQRIATKGVKPDAAEVERLYREAVREWKVTSVLLEKEEDAKAFEAALKAGGKFDALVKKAIADKKAKGDGKAEWLSPRHALPEIVAAARAAKVGVPAAPVRVTNGWVVLRVEASRVPKDDAAARADAKARSLARKEREAIRAFYLGLVKRHAKVNEALLEKLDLEAGGEKGYEALLKDARPLATIQGEPPVTVADLAREVSMKFFHGMASPIEQHRVNPQKVEAFEKILGKRLFAKEAAARKLANEPELVREVEDYERALAFNTFVQKVLAPGVKVTEGEVATHYEKHLSELTGPEMLRLEGVAFPTTKEAQAALEKAKTGTDFGWLRQNAAGQLQPGKRSLQMDGALVSANTLPGGLVKALAGARGGEYRLYAASSAEVYVVRVAQRIAPQPQPYAEARDKIAKQLYGEKLAASLRDYAAKLREAQKVDVLITRVSL